MVGMANIKIFFKVTGFKYTFWFSIFFLLDFCFDPACISCIKHHKPYSNSAVNSKQKFRRKNFLYPIHPLSIGKIRNGCRLAPHSDRLLR